MKNICLTLLILTLFFGCSFTKPSHEGISRHVIYPGCEAKHDKKTCFMRKIHTHMKRNLDKDVFSNKGFSGKVKMYVNFMVDKQGITKVLDIKAPHEEFKKELNRVFKSVPKMKPQLQKGEAVDTSFTLPVSFVCR